jgi:hypothetical protein
LTKKEEAQAKREEKLRLERERVAGMRSFEREAVGTLLGGIMLPEGFLICGIDEVRLPDRLQPVPVFCLRIMTFCI